MRTRTAKYVAAAAVALVIAFGIIQLGKPVIQPGALYAAAIDSVRHARTFSCIRISDMPYRDGPKRGTFVLKQKRMFKEPDWERHEQLTSAPSWPQDVGKVTIWHYDKRQRLEFKPFDKSADLDDLSSEYTLDEETGRLKLTQLDTRIRDYVLEWSAGAVEDLGNIDLDGRSVRLLQSRGDERVTTVWVDPKTSHPVQIEHVWNDRKSPPVTFTSIQIDADLDDGLFRLEPPEGYSLRVNKPRWPDYRSKMMTKIKHLGLWCVLYSSENGGRFPDELADVGASGVITDAVLNTVLAAPDDPDGPPVIRYRKPDPNATNRFTELILYEAHDSWPQDGIVTCFADGHAEVIVDQGRFSELME